MPHEIESPLTCPWSSVPRILRQEYEILLTDAKADMQAGGDGPPPIVVTLDRRGRLHGHRLWGPHHADHRHAFLCAIVQHDDAVAVMLFADINLRDADSLAIVGEALSASIETESGQLVEVITRYTRNPLAFAETEITPYVTRNRGSVFAMPQH